MFKLEEISKSFADGDKKKVIFDHFSYEFPQKGMVFIVGKSGCGKSTLLNLLAGFDYVDSGEISYLSKSIEKMSESELTSYYENEIGFIFQEYNLIESLNVFENIAICCTEEKQSRESKVSNALEKVRMKGYEKRKISQLSGGQKQRVSIARALCGEVKVLLCDEPTGALDKENSKEVFNILKDVSKTSLVIVVSHDTEAPNQYGDIILSIEKGKLIEKSSKDFPKNTQDEIFNCSSKKKTINTMKMGSSFAFCKKLRLSIAVLLTSITLSAFGISSSFITFSKTDAVLKHMTDNKQTYISYQKELEYKINDYTKTFTINMSNDDITDLTNYAGYDALAKYNYFTQKISNIVNFPSGIYQNNIMGFCEISSNVIEEFDFELFGSLPSNDNEVVITDYTYEMFKRCGYVSFDSGACQINSYVDLINKSISLKLFECNSTAEQYKIVGIVNTKFNDAIFDPLDGDFQKHSENIERYIKQYFNTSLEQTVFLKEGFYQRNITPYNANHYSEFGGIVIENNALNYNKDLSIISYTIPSSTNVIYKNGALNDTGIILPLESFYSSKSICLSNYVYEYAESVFPSIETSFDSKYGDDSTYIDYATYLKSKGYVDTEFLPITYEELTIWCISYFINFKGIFSDNPTTMYLKRNTSNSLDNLEIQGISYDGNEKTVYLSQSNFENLIDGISYYNNDIVNCYLPLSSRRVINKKMIGLNNLVLSDCPTKVIDTTYKVTECNLKVDNLSSYIYDSINEGYSVYKYILTGVGCALLVFSIVFILFDVKGTINAKIKEIGILKSLGIAERNVELAFMVYSFIFTILVVILTNVFCLIGENIIYTTLCNLYSCKFRFLDYSFIEVISGLLLTFILCCVCSIVSIKKTYKKKTIDLLR